MLYFAVGSHFSLGSTARPKMFVISRILAEFLVYAIVRLIRISAEFSLQPLFFRLQIGGLAMMYKICL